MWAVLVLLLAAKVVSALLDPLPAVSFQRAVVPSHPSSQLRLQLRSTAENASILPVSLSQDEQSYYVLINLGNIYFRAALDTASSDLWITSSSCTTTTCKAVPRYPLSYQSPSFVPVNDNGTVFNISYVDGTFASGFVARETLSLSNTSVARQAFGMITQSNVTLRDQISGVLGLGFPRLSVMPSTVVNATPFFANLAQHGDLDCPLFGLSLPKNSTGSLSLGAVDASVVRNASDIHWNEVMPFPPFGSRSNTSSYLHWVVPFSGLSVNGTQITPTPTYPNATGNMSIALLDVGTVGLYGPFHDVSRLFSLFPGSRLVDASGQWAIPCSSARPITLVLGERNYTLQPSDYLIGAAAGNPNICLAWPRALPPSSDGIDWQLGSVFLRTVYSVFSYGINTKEPPMVGFYALSNTSTPPETPQNISSYLSSASATIATTLPNFPLATPSPATLSYIFNASISASLGQIALSEHATSTYSPIVGPDFYNASALPTISPSPTVTTIVTTNSAGLSTTFTQAIAQASITLGVPPGWSSSHALPRFHTTTALVSHLLISSLTLSIIGIL